MITNAENIKKHWKNNPDKYKAHVEKMRLYARDNKVYYRNKLKKFMLKNRNYMTDYGRAIRLKCKHKGICITCHKVKAERKAKRKFTQCVKCRINRKIWYKNK